MKARHFQCIEDGIPSSKCPRGFAGKYVTQVPFAASDQVSELFLVHLALLEVELGDGDEYCVKCVVHQHLSELN